MGLPVVEEQQGNPHDAEAHTVKHNLTHVDRVVGIHSGKGGVGKTFLTVNTAFLLSAAGKKVGILDADVDCPNIARFLNIRDVPLEGTDEGRIVPLTYKGLKIVSTHFLTDDPSAPMIIRGPIKHKVLHELLSRVDWGKLDVLLIDLPPGTADVPMSSMIIGNMDGVLIVTTPQKEALLDARKSILMAKDMDIVVVGVVENMSGDVFGEKKGIDLAQEMDVPYVGTIPLSKEIRVLSEKGKPSLTGSEFSEIAKQLSMAVSGEKLTIKKSKWNILR